MSRGIRYTDEFKQEAVNQIIVHGHSVLDVSERLGVSTKSLYDWQKTFSRPLSNRETVDKRLKNQIKQYWLLSGGHSDYRNIHLDLAEAKIQCSRDRVLRLMRESGLRARRGYKRPKAYYFGKVYLAAPNILERQFEVDKPNQSWVSDITYIHTQEGFLFLAVVMDLFARNIVGWSMGPRIKDD